MRPHISVCHIFTRPSSVQPWSRCAWPTAGRCVTHFGLLWLNKVSVLNLSRRNVLTLPWIPWAKHSRVPHIFIVASQGLPVTEWNNEEVERKQRGALAAGVNPWPFQPHFWHTLNLVSLLHWIPLGRLLLKNCRRQKQSLSNVGNTKGILGTNVTRQRRRALDERLPQSPTDGFAIVCVWRVEAVLQTEAAAVDFCSLWRDQRGWQGPVSVLISICMRPFRGQIRQNNCRIPLCLYRGDNFMGSDPVR